MSDVFRTLARLIAAWALGLATLAAPAAAQQLFTFAETRAFVDGSGHSGTGARISIDWAAEVKIGRFLGEPVVSTRFRYDLDGGLVTLPTSTVKGAPYETHTLGALPQVAQEMMRLYDVTLKIEFASPQGDLYLLSDVGLPGKPGEWSFNVPGSPEWDRLFIHVGSSPQNPRYLSAEEASALVKAGLSATGASVLSAGLTLYDLHSWYERENPGHYLDVYDRALDRLEEGIYLSYGLPGYAGRDAFQPATLKEKFEALPGYKRLYEKYRSLPDAMKAGDNHTPYTMARQQAAEIIRRGQYSQPDFSSDQEILPGPRTRGSEATFQGRYAIETAGRGFKTVSKQYLIRESDGARIREVRNGTILPFGLYYTPRYYKCENGRARIDFRDPESGNVARSLDLSCGDKPGLDGEVVLSSNGSGSGLTATATQEEVLGSRSVSGGRFDRVEKTTTTYGINTGFAIISTRTEQEILEEFVEIRAPSSGRCVPFCLTGRP